MKVIEEPRQVEIDLPDAEALIKEARQRQRRRRLLISILLLLAMVVSAVSYALVSRPSGRARHTRASSPTKTVSATQSGSYVSPKAPTTLVVAPNGDLLAVDSGRDQILRHLPSGKFQVLAGDGKRGFSGDGGPAVRARINVQGNSGIAVAQDGTVYFSDSGNGRVREVLPDGVIKTIVGGGTREIEQGSISRPPRSWRA
jgi:sugar lactone lactonase YvrE